MTGRLFSPAKAWAGASAVTSPSSKRSQPVICFGYPLCGAGDRTKLRDQVLLELETPILFAQGTRDALCPLELLQGVRKRMRASSTLHVVDGGDHSLLVAKSTLKALGSTQDEADEGIRTAIARFLKDALRESR
jgi:uncharacterized protein